MRLCIISDTHTCHKKLRNLPDADVIIHCGDSTSMGYEHEIRDFMKWYSNLSQYKHKIIIAGNHDWLFEKNLSLAKTYIPENVIYLEDNGVEIDGVKFWGTPVSKPFYNWAFNRPEEKLALHWAAVPDDIDVLITHSPPFAICDYVPYNQSHQGSTTLYHEVINRIKPKLHCFGHIHEGNGKRKIEGITFINASNLNGEYHYVNEAVIFEI